MDIELPTPQYFQRQAAAAQAKISEFEEIRAAREDQLRQVLSYCEDQAQHSGYALEESAYQDIAGKLRGILDGEQ